GRFLIISRRIPDVAAVLRDAHLRAGPAVLHLAPEILRRLRPGRADYPQLRVAGHHRGPHRLLQVVIGLGPRLVDHAEVQRIAVTGNLRTGYQAQHGTVPEQVRLAARPPAHVDEPAQLRPLDDRPP